MLYELFEFLKEHIGVLNVFRYLTFRSILAFLLTFILVVCFEPVFIRWFRERKLGQPIRDDGPQSHLSKKGTPTMGGLVVVVAVVATTFLLADLSNIYVWAVLAVTIGYAALGFADDYLKISGQNSKGVCAKTKLYWQFGIAAGLVFLLFLFEPKFSSGMVVPFLKDTELALGWWYLPFATLVIVGCSNAVNLTDGLDGLVIGPVMTVALTYGIFAYASGNVEHARYLHIPYIAGAGDLAIFAAAIVAGGLGFLWYNTFPAQVFMGDVGALALGGALGMMAVITKQELLLAVTGGVFVVEAVSVILQVASFKLTGKRILRMAPIHHHFELGGMAEPKIIVRAWIISILLTILALVTLKLR